MRRQISPRTTDASWSTEVIYRDSCSTDVASFVTEVSANCCYVWLAAINLMSGPHCVPFVKQAWRCCFSILVWVGINIQSDCWLLQEICNYAQAASNLRAVSWGLKYRWFLFFTKLDHYFQNEHHAALKNSWNYRLRPWTHEESVYWGSESREKEAHFLISSNTITLLCATSGIAPLEAPFIFHRGRAAATKTSLLHHEVWSSDENFFWKM